MAISFSGNSVFSPAFSSEELDNYLNKRQSKGLSDADRNKIEIEISPFFERLTRKIGINKITLCTTYGLALFLIHYVSYRTFSKNIFDDFNWILPIDSAIILFFLFVATHNLKKFATSIYNVFRLESDNKKYYYTVKSTLTDSNMIKYGIFFGFFNSLMGYSFGIWFSKSSFLYYLSLFEFFNIGFVCGLCFSGIPCIIKMSYLLSIEKKSIDIDLGNPDKCGGTSPIGLYIAKFALLILLASLFISSYVYRTDWVNDSSGIVYYLVKLWIIFPQLIALSMFVSSALFIRKIVHRLKDYHLNRLSEAMYNLQQHYLNKLPEIDLKNLHEMLLIDVVHSRLEKISGDIKEMNVWPYNLNSGAPYIIAYVMSFIAPINQLTNFLF